MKTEVKISRYQLVEERVEINLPYYGRYSDVLDDSPVSWDSYIRIEDDGSVYALKVTEDRGATEYEFEIKRGNLATTIPNLSHYDEIDKAKYQAAVEAARAELGKF